jgi:peptide/nickel transport system permease protein
MSEPLTPSPSTPSPPTTFADRRTRPRSWIGRALFDTFGRTGAKLGAIWIGVIAFCAAFAPLIANSHPILMQRDGQWSSPLIKHLTAVDITLLITAVAALTLLPLKKIKPPRKLWALVSIVTLTAILSLLFIRTPRAIVYEKYRQDIQQRRITWVLWTPIPYSPSDRQRDTFIPDRPHPWNPETSHLLGTERNGADILSRMIHASRIALSIGFIAEGLALVIGVFIGGIMGYFAGIFDLIGMRLVEVFSSIPRIYLLLTFVAFFGRNLYLIMVIIGLTSWVGYAMFTRAEFLRLRQQDFVHAAIACGLPLRSILFKHILPNGMAPVLVNVSFGVASAILAESTLSFLGLGLVDDPSWGELLNQALSPGGGFRWWLATFPGLAIFLTVCAYNLIGESVRDAIDPRLQRTTSR